MTCCDILLRQELAITNTHEKDLKFAIEDLKRENLEIGITNLKMKREEAT
jgi:hypothetical protein